jgi:hypothetical protein
MSFFDSWVTFNDGPAGCIVRPPKHEEPFGRDEVAALAEKFTGKKVIAITQLPYAARPVLNRSPDWPAGWAMVFCYDPKNCGGLSSCPRRTACCD